MIVLKRASLGLAVLLVVCAASTAHADDKDAARAKFQQGVEQFQNGDYVGALEHFEAADRAHHDPSITYNIGRANEALGRAHRAITAYERYIAEAGEAGQFVSAAALAVAQLKARSTRLRIVSRPAGATVRLDGHELAERTPITVYVLKGWHRIEVDGNGLEAGRDYDAKGGGTEDEIAFEPAAKPKPPKPKPKPKPPPPAAPKQPTRWHPDGLVGGAALSLSRYQFVGSAKETSSTSTTTSDSAAAGFAFGLLMEAGYAVSKRTEILLRGLGALGSSESELATLGAGGPAVSWRAGDDFWLGAGLVLGGSRADSDATTTEPVAGARRDAAITFRTDFAIGPMLELSYVLEETSSGQFLVSLLPATLVTTGGEQSTIVVPLVVGHRWF